MSGPGDIANKAGAIIREGGGELIAGRVMVSSEQAEAAEDYGWRVIAGTSEPSVVVIERAQAEADEFLRRKGDPVSAILQERGKVHGDFADVARVAQELKNYTRQQKNWPMLSQTQREGLDMIDHKKARILVGDPDHHDHWDDVAGYAKCVSVRLPKKEVS